MITKVWNKRDLFTAGRYDQTKPRHNTGPHLTELFYKTFTFLKLKKPSSISLSPVNIVLSCRLVRIRRNKALFFTIHNSSFITRLRAPGRTPSTSRPMSPPHLLRMPKNPAKRKYTTASPLRRRQHFPQGRFTKTISQAGLRPFSLRYYFRIKNRGSRRGQPQGLKANLGQTGH